MHMLFKLILFLVFHKYDCKFRFSVYCVYIEYDCGYVSEILERNSTGSIVQ